MHVACKQSMGTQKRLVANNLVSKQQIGFILTFKSHLDSANAIRDSDTHWLDHGPQMLTVGSQISCTAVDLYIKCDGSERENK